MSSDDNPELDDMDGAHPEWWRGHQVGVLGTVRALVRVLDGRHTGTFSEPELQALAERLTALSRLPRRGGT